MTRLAGATVFTLSKLTDEKGARKTQGTLSVGETWNRAAKVSETGSFEVEAGGTTAAVEGTAFVASCVPVTEGSQTSIARSLRWWTTARSTATCGTSPR